MQRNTICDYWTTVPLFIPNLMLLLLAHPLTRWLMGLLMLWPVLDTDMMVSVFDRFHFFTSHSCFQALLLFEVMSFTSLISFHLALSLWRPFVCIGVWDVNLLLIPRFLFPLIRPSSVSVLMRLTSSSLYGSLGPLLLPVHPSGAWSLRIPTNHCSRPLLGAKCFVNDGATKMRDVIQWLCSKT